MATQYKVLQEDSNTHEKDIIVGTLPDLVNKFSAILKTGTKYNAVEINERPYNIVSLVKMLNKTMRYVDTKNIKFSLMEHGA